LVPKALPTKNIEITPMTTPREVQAIPIPVDSAGVKFWVGTCTNTGISALWAGPSSGATPKWRVAIGGGKGSVGIYAFANDDTTASVEKLKVVDRAHRGSVQSVCSADGKHFVSGAADETTMVWELSQQLPVREMPNSLYCAVTAHQLVFGAGTQGNVKVITSTTCRTEK
jgi:WD40 repeat protein